MRRRRLLLLLMLALAVMGWVVSGRSQYAAVPEQQPTVDSPIATERKPISSSGETLAISALEKLAVKGRAAKTGYSRTQFGDGWETFGGCDMRNRILQRDLVNTVLNEECKVMSGTLHDPYTGQIIAFTRGATTSALVQIDHVVALSNAWQTGAQQLSLEQRISLANDPLELLAVDGDANQQKSDGDAATWLPANKIFRCQYVARQIAVKIKYLLWVTLPEKQAMQNVLSKCPEQALP